MTRTTNYDLIVVEGSDKVNLLTQMNPNTEKIDEVMKTNEKSGVQVATELFSGTVHAITRTVKSASMFKFAAVSNYTAGDTFTVDGIQVTALLTSGEALGTGAYIIGSEVLCSLKDTLLTVYTQGGTIKLADDSEKLGGNLPEYYAKQSDLNNVKITADNASSLSRQNSDKINNINQNLSNKTVGIEINKNIVTENYSYAYLKSGIGILNIDIVVDKIPLNTEVEILYTGFRPHLNLFINTINSNGNNITIIIDVNGIVKLYSSTSIKFGIRTQLIIV